MPCDSRIVTKLTEGNKIADALRANGYDVTHMTEKAVVGWKGGREIVFSRAYGTGDAFAVSGNRVDFTSIARKYAEIGVLTFARRKGYSVTENDGTQVTLINRRG
jgi:hypothetical protein